MSKLAFQVVSSHMVVIVIKDGFLRKVWISNYGQVVNWCLAKMEMSWSFKARKT